MEAFSAKLYHAGEGIMIFFLESKTTKIIKDVGTSEMDDFYDEYLSLMNEQYPGHIKGIHQLLKMCMGAKKYNNISKIPFLLKRHVAFQSLKCAFPKMDNIPAYDGNGNFDFKYGHRTGGCFMCPYCGYRDNENKDLSVYNPIYHTSLTSMEIEVASQLINSMRTTEDIRNILNCSMDEITKIEGSIYKKMKVNNRFELKYVLNNKRIK